MRADRPSATSLVIAASFVHLNRSGIAGALVPVESVRVGEWVLGHHSALSRLVLRALDFAGFRAAIRGLERCSVPGMTEHYAERKRGLEQIVRGWTPGGRLVVLGAGFDTLGLRVAAEDPGRTVIEVDHPATQAWKRRAVEAGGFATKRLSFWARDLSKETDFGEAASTIWIAEGLLMYFDERRVGEILDAVRSASTPGSRIAFTFLEPDVDGRVGFRRPSRALDLWLARRRESFTWGIRRSEVAAFLQRWGFRSVDVAAEITRGMDRLRVGEYLAVGEVI